MRINAPLGRGAAKNGSFDEVDGHRIIYGLRFKAWREYVGGRVANDNVYRAFKVIGRLRMNAGKASLPDRSPLLTLSRLSVQPVLNMDTVVKTAPKTVATIKAKLARLEVRKAALLTYLTDKNRFAPFHGKTNARATARALGFRASADPAVLDSLGLTALSEAEKTKLSSILAAFKESPWTPEKTTKKPASSTPVPNPIVFAASQGRVV